MDVLPYTSVGKLDRKTLRQWGGNGRRPASILDVQRQSGGPGHAASRWQARCECSEFRDGVHS